MTGLTRWKLIGYTAALFAAGAVCGAVLLPRPVSREERMKVECEREIADKIREKLRTSVGLTPEQLARIDPLIRKTSREVEASHKDCLSRISAALECLHSQLCSELNPGQKQKLLELEAERRAKMWERYGFISLTNGL